MPLKVVAQKQKQWKKSLQNEEWNINDKVVAGEMTGKALWHGSISI